MTDAPICPKCGQAAAQEQTRFGVRSACCDLWSWKGAPLVCAKTHQARQDAHRAFDRLWKDGHMTRSAAYRWLSKTLEIPPERCHIRMMDASTALDVECVAEEYYFHEVVGNVDLPD